ncbi:hypothetical protein RCO48_30160 [Peribacillus frigoritolerans]|nr:hypothetical protein [Peribacillus frigoritolerans]
MKEKKGNVGKAIVDYLFPTRERGGYTDHRSDRNKWKDDNDEIDSLFSY